MGLPGQGCKLMRPAYPRRREFTEAPPRRSRWLWWVYLGFGIVSFIGFLIVAVKVQNRRFVRAAVISFVACAASFAAREIWPLAPDVSQNVTSEQSADLGSTSISTWIIMGIWIGLIVYGHVLNRDYKKFLRDEDHENLLRWHSNRAQTQAFTAPYPSGFAPQPHYQSAPNADPGASSTPQADPLRAEADRFLAVQPLGNAPTQAPPNIPG